MGIGEGYSVNWLVIKQQNEREDVGQVMDGFRFYSCNRKTSGNFKQVSEPIQYLIKSFCCYGRKCSRLSIIEAKGLSRLLLQKFQEEMVFWMGNKTGERLWKTDKIC